MAGPVDVIGLGDNLLSPFGGTTPPSKLALANVVTQNAAILANARADADPTPVSAAVAIQANMAALSTAIPILAMDWNDPNIPRSEVVADGLQVIGDFVNIGSSILNLDPATKPWAVGLNLFGDALTLTGTYIHSLNDYNSNIPVNISSFLNSGISTDITDAENLFSYTSPIGSAALGSLWVPTDDALMAALSAGGSGTESPSVLFNINSANTVFQTTNTAINTFTSGMDLSLPEIVETQNSNGVSISNTSGTVLGDLTTSGGSPAEGQLYNSYNGSANGSPIQQSYVGSSGGAGSVLFGSTQNTPATNVQQFLNGDGSGAVSVDNQTVDYSAGMFPVATNWVSGFTAGQNVSLDFNSASTSVATVTIDPATGNVDVGGPNNGASIDFVNQSEPISLGTSENGDTVVDAGATDSGLGEYFTLGLNGDVDTDFGGVSVFLTPVGTNITDINGTITSATTPTGGWVEYQTATANGQFGLQLSATVNSFSVSFSYSFQLGGGEPTVQQADLDGNSYTAGGSTSFANFVDTTTSAANASDVDTSEDQIDAQLSTDQIAIDNNDLSNAIGLPTDLEDELSLLTDDGSQDENSGGQASQDASSGQNIDVTNPLPSPSPSPSPLPSPSPSPSPLPSPSPSPSPSPLPSPSPSPAPPPGGGSSYDPLVISTNENGISLVPLNKSNVKFDFTGSGTKVHTGWIGPNTGFVIYNPSGSTTITGAELIDSFAALAALDSNDDGVLNASDPAFAHLEVWIDGNEDGISEPGELISLGALGIESISTGSTAADVNVAGNTVTAIGTLTLTNGTTEAVDAVTFATTSSALPPLTLNGESGPALNFLSRVQSELPANAEGQAAAVVASVKNVIASLTAPAATLQRDLEEANKPTVDGQTLSASEIYLVPATKLITVAQGIAAIAAPAAVQGAESSVAQALGTLQIAAQDVVTASGDQVQSESAAIVANTENAIIGSADDATAKTVASTTETGWATALQALATADVGLISATGSVNAAQTVANSIVLTSSEDYATSWDAQEAADTLTDQAVSAQALALGDVDLQTNLAAVAAAYNASQATLALPGMTLQAAGGDLIVAVAGSETLSDGASPSTYVILPRATATISNFHAGPGGSRLYFEAEGSAASLAAVSNGTEITVATSSVLLIGVSIASLSLYDNFAGVSSVSIASSSTTVTLTPEVENYDDGTTHVQTITGTTGDILALAPGTAGYTLSGVGTNLSGFKSITEQAGATWQLSGSNTIAAGVSLTNAGTLSNLGTLISAGALIDAGTLLNTGYLSGGVTPTSNGYVYNGPGASISRSLNPVYSPGTGIRINNYGSITATSSTSGAGIILHSSGHVTNGGGARIAGYDGVKIYGTAGSVVNTGTISTVGAGANAGIYFSEGGGVTNGVPGTAGARISGSYFGIKLAGTIGTINNFGSITAYGTGNYAEGIYLNTGYIKNGSAYSSGNLIRGVVGLVVHASGSIENYGTINGTGTNAWGVLLGGGGLVENGSGVTPGLIVGGHIGVYIQNEPGSVTSYGTITGSSGVGILFNNGGSVSNQGLISGAGNGINIAHAAGFINNAGTVAATGSVSYGSGAYLNSGSVVNGNTAAINATIQGVFGIIFDNGGSVANYGTISASGSKASGVLLGNGGTVSNGSFDITSPLISGVANGIYIEKSPGTVLNTGRIVGGVGSGVVFGVGGTIVNGTTVVRDAEIVGGAGVYILGNGSIRNYGTVFGNDGGGINIADAGSIVNYGTIHGKSGAGVSIGGGLVVNGASNQTGTLIEGAIGVVLTGGGTIVNSGTVIGYGGTAIELGSGTSQLVLYQGSTLSGIVGNFQAGDSIDLPFLPFTGDGTVALQTNNVLLVNEDGTKFSIDLDPNQSFSGISFQLAEAPGGGTLLSEALPPSQSPAVLNDFSWQQGWGDPNNPRIVADVNGGPNSDYIGFGDNYTFIAYGGTFENAENQMGPGFSPSIAAVQNFGTDEGYTDAAQRGVATTGSGIGDSIYGQGYAGIYWYGATGETPQHDAAGNTYQVLQYGMTPNFYGNFGSQEGWTPDNGFQILKTTSSDPYASILGFGDSGIVVGPQAFAPGATAANSYVIPFAAGNNSGWDQLNDIRTFQDIDGNPIDLNHDGITDFVGMGPQGLVFAFGNDNGPGGSYQLGALQQAQINGTNDDLGDDQGWSDSNTVRYIVPDVKTGYDDIIAFGNAGVEVSMGQNPATNNGQPFGQLYLAIANFGGNQGWSVSETPRLVGDVNGDGTPDIVGFGYDSTFVATGSYNTNGQLVFTMQPNDTIGDFGSAEGWSGSNPQTVRALTNVTISGGSSHADLLLSGAYNTQIWQYG